MGSSIPVDDESKKPMAEQSQVGSYYQHPPPPPISSPVPEDPLKEIFRTVKAILWSTGFIAFLLVLTLSFIIVLAMTPEIQNWINTPAPSADDPSVLGLPQEYIFIIVPFPLLLFTVQGTGFQAWHFLMLAFLVAAFGYSKYTLWKDWLSRKGQFILSLTAPEKAKSSLEGVAKLFMACVFFSTLYFVFLSLISVEMSTPAFDELSRPELIYGLFNASVFEELVSRVLLIGVPIVIIGLVMKWQNPLKKIIGGGLDITPITMGLITFSAIFFALAHVGGWDFWKVPQVLITGFALGYAFVRYGLHASILIHFSINLSSSAMEIWPDNLVISALLGMSMIIWIVAGGYFFFDYIWRLVKKMGFVPEPQPAQQMYTPQPGHAEGNRYQHPPPYQQQPTSIQPPVPAHQPHGNRGFTCPNCGNTGASYANGILTCMRCGTNFGEQKTSEQKNNEKEIYEY